MPTDRRSITLKDVASAAGVHVSTASRALDPTRSRRISAATIERVERAASQLGYLPDVVAQGLKRGVTTDVGVIVTDLEDPFIGPVIRGVTSVLEYAGHITFVAETRGDHQRLESILNHVASRRVSAVVTTAARTSDRHLLVRFAERLPALVLAVQNIEGSGLPFVIHDDRHGAELATEHVMGLGHTVLAQLRGPDAIELFKARAEIRRTVGANGGVDVTVSDIASEPTTAEGRRLMARTLDGNRGHRPTAVFAHTDVMALGAIAELRSRGLRCPEDISIIGYDDAPLVSLVEPSLSTVRLPGREIGRHAGEMLSQLLNDPETQPPSVTVAATLVPRGSTAPPPDR